MEYVYDKSCINIEKIAEPAHKTCSVRVAQDYPVVSS